MEVILLSGGSGKRLWPLSNDSRSKQFIKVLENKNGIRESMVQRVWNQITNVGLSDSCVIATSKSQVEIIQNHLGIHVPLIIEPERRDTFPAIVLAAAYLYSMKGVNLNESVVVLPVDPYVEEQFFNKIKELDDILIKENADLALIGVQPTYPSSKYGYIVPLEENYNHEYLQVSHFKEKPSEKKAAKLISQNALWNAGVFAFKLNFIISLLIEKGLPLQYDLLLNEYDSLPKVSFDYEVVEKAKNIYVLPYDGYWKDLGTWNTLTDEMACQQIGKGMVSEDSENSHLINELDIPVAILGLSNVVVAASPDGILVTEKSASPRVKELVSEFDQRPMYEERSWGWYRVLDYVKYHRDYEVLTKRICLKSGKNLSYQIHQKRQETWTIIQGGGLFVLNDRIIPIQTGNVLQIPIGSKHAIKANTDLEFIEIQTGSELIEEDIERLLITWEEIEQYCQGRY